MCVQFITYLFVISSNVRYKFYVVIQHVFFSNLFSEYILSQSEEICFSV